MRRISSLPTAEFCPKVDRIGLDVESTQSMRSTIFHEYCDTGEWPDAIRYLPAADAEEIQKWRAPMPFSYQAGDATYALPYSHAHRELRVALDAEFNTVDVPPDVAQADIEKLFPEVMICGHLDMGWCLPERDLVIVSDIKSSIFAVKEGTRSLQLHGYGIAYAKLLGMGRYVTSIWDACEGEYHVHPYAIELDSFECGSIMDRITKAATERDGNFLTGTHCNSCWKRSHCPAHLVDVPEGEFAPVLSGQATEKDVRDALVRLKQIGDLKERVDSACKRWVEQHGPVRSEDGRKQYRAELCDGKKGLDKAAVAKALGKKDLDEYMKPGRPYSAFNWRVIRDP